MRGACLALACAVASLPAAADIVSRAPDSVRVTIYRDPNSGARVGLGQEAEYLGSGIAMVNETRTVDIPRGASRIIFRGVADAIVPQTAGIDGLPAVILESNFDYDLLTPGAIIAKSHGERVQLIRTDTASGRVVTRNAIVRMGPTGVLLEMDGGGIEALDCSGLAEKLVFERVPAGLADEPALSIKIRSAKPGRHKLRLSYLALGLDWSADYVATINPDGRTLNLVGWLTLINHASTTFANAPTEVVAGNLARDQEETQPPRAAIIEKQSACWPIGSFITYPAARVSSHLGATSPIYAVMQSSAIQQVDVTGTRASLDAQLGELGDYKLYTLPEPTTVAARQSKQVRFLGQHDVPFERLYSFLMNEDAVMGDGDHTRRRPSVTLRLQNKKSDGLGKPLPAGAVVVMEPAAGARAALAGVDRMQDTPVGLPVELELGTAMDVWLEPRVLKDETIRERGIRQGRRVQVEAKFGNDKPLPVTLELRQPAGVEGFEITSESQQHTLKSGDPLWTFRLEPGERGSLQYEFRVAG